MADITGANAIFTITIPGLFPTPIQLQGFAADDVFETDPLESVETAMGVDGVLSAGFVFVPVRQRIALQADSASNLVFDTWWAQMQASRGIFTANGVVIMPSVGTRWALNTGFLRQYQPMPHVKKLLSPRAHHIEWQQVTPAVF